LQALKTSVTGFPVNHSEADALTEQRKALRQKHRQHVEQMMAEQRQRMRDNSVRHDKV
jgi:hypothetical protein